jgi:hypothetical protein
MLPCISLFIGGCQSAMRKAGSIELDKMDIFLLAGQSNMAGRGTVESFDRLVWPNLFSLDREGKWIPAVDPIHFDKPRAGVGPGLTFGRVVADAYPDKKIGLVPAACGGSPIAAWRPGAYHLNTKSHPYDDAVARVRRAMADGRLRAILWIQGESDSTVERAPLYYECLKELIMSLRHDLGSKTVPFLIGHLPRFSPASNPSRDAVTAAQQRVARELPEVYFVDMPVLTGLPDGIHADAASAREMGRRLAEAYLQISGKEPVAK